MITKDLLEKVIKDQAEKVLNKKNIERVTKLQLAGNLVNIISGVRRCGKSHFLKYQLSRQYDHIYTAFEDPRLEGFEFSDFIKIEEIAIKNNIEIFFFDEIQNIEGWEKFIRYLNDKEKKVFITGSNASLLSRELGSRLTGRYLQTELFPFSFKEYLNYTEETENEISFMNYLLKGGFPEFLETNDYVYLRTLFTDILYRDIVIRRKIRNEYLLKRLAVYLVSNIGKELSYNNLANTLNIKSVRTVIDYCDYLSDCYLFEFIPEFSFSLQKEYKGLKKVYSVDTGMVKANSVSFSDDYGRLLENAVFVHLRNYYSNIYFYRSKNNECDFIVKEGKDVIYAIQVCWQMNQDNLKREIEGLKAAATASRAKKAIILTFNQEDHFDDISVIPFWKWILSQN